MLCSGHGRREETSYVGLGSRECLFFVRMRADRHRQTSQTDFTETFDTGVVESVWD
jgi:hypothetical protein